MEDSLLAIGRGRPRKTKGETTENDLDLNGIVEDMIYDKTP